MSLAADWLGKTQQKEAPPKHKLSMTSRLKQAWQFSQIIRLQLSSLFSYISHLLCFMEKYDYLKLSVVNRLMSWFNLSQPTVLIVVVRYQFSSLCFTSKWMDSDNLAKQLVYNLPDCLTACVSCPVWLHCSDAAMFPDPSSYFGEYIVIITNKKWREKLQNFLLLSL